MAISLNGVNSEVARAHKRIDDIQSSGSKSITVIWTGNNTATINTPNMSNYSGIITIGYGSDNWSGYGGLVIPMDYFKSIKNFKLFQVGDRQSRIEYISDTQVKYSAEWGGSPRCFALIK